MSELVNAALHGDVALPELTVSSTAGHGSKQEIIYFDDFSNLVRRDEGSLSGSSINCYQDTLLEFKSQGGRSL